MRIEQELFFWMGGIFCPTIEQALNMALKTFGVEDTSPAAQALAKENAVSLALGNMSTADFCAGMVNAVELKADPAELEAVIVKSLTIDSEMLSSIEELNEDLKLRLIVDLPARWVRDIGGYKSFAAHFDQIITLEECGLDSMIPQVFDLIRDNADVPGQQIVVLDSDLKRCVAGISSRIPTAIIIDKFYMDREFLFREMTGKGYELHPNPLL